MADGRCETLHGDMLKTFREVYPDSSVVVFDKAAPIGGVWAEDKLYPGLRTNNHFQTLYRHRGRVQGAEQEMHIVQVDLPVRHCGRSGSVYSPCTPPSFGTI